ncbi:MAG: sulfotransferase family protein [Marinirhabdus sp.]|nr:sulfotransferase family protein [Marinirhabdus sp.]
MGRFNKHIIIVGSARSGTSWLAETIGKQHRYRMLFEPDHEFQTKDGHLLRDQYVTKKDGFEQGHRYLERVFANRVDSDWIAQNSNRKWKRHLWPFISKKFVIKFVRCNLSAHYMQEAFGIPVLHIIRNPYEVLQSQQRVKFPWLYDLSHFANQPNLVALLLEHFNFDITQWERYNELERLAIRWCVENSVPFLGQSQNNQNYRVVRYEDLRKDKQVFLKLCDDFNLQPLSNLEEEYRKPSSKTHPKSVIVKKGAVQESFSEENKSSIRRILDTFEITLYPKNPL